MALYPIRQDSSIIFFDLKFSVNWTVANKINKYWADAVFLSAHTLGSWDAE
jgi:hypothetical protein